MPELTFQIITLTADAILFGMAGYFFFRFRKREEKLEKKEQKLDSDYHHVVNEALSKERQIIDDATREADQIITGANYIKHNAHEAVEEAIQKIVTEIQQDADTTATLFMQRYTASLENLSTQSVADYRRIVKDMESNLQREMKTFHEAMLPALRKELDAYRTLRMQETDRMTRRVVTKASQEIMNKSLSLDDHHALMTQALDKAKKEGLFE